MSNRKQMQKNILLVLMIGLVWMACTKEQLPSGLNLKDLIKTEDTTYLISTIPTAQTRHILMEEPTGVRCPNCPDGAELMHDLKIANPGRILSVSVYSPFLNDSVPPAKYNFNTPDAEELVNFLGGDPQKPTSSINRIPTGYVTPPIPYFFSKADWATKVASELTKTTPLNLELNVIPNGTDYYLKSKVTFTESISDSLVMSVYIIEDSIIDLQEFPSSVIDLNYVHNHVLRKMVTPVSGSNFLSTMPIKEKGRVFERTFSITLPSNIVNPAHVKLLCFVHKTGASKEVIQVEEVDL
ncbi:MAG: Omp28-related outer membrane protein [Bacteroidetes bacterium]|nr:Omp28-related outer membrane protein [Bacteroidota bacterium]